MSIVWTERKRIWCGLPLTFTIYSYDEERFYIKTGFLNQREDEVRLYRVQDLTVTRSFIQRIFGMGSIHVNSSDKTMGDFEIRNIKNVAEVKEKLKKAIEENVGIDYGRAKTYTVGNWLEVWYENYAKIKVPFQDKCC